MKRLLKSTKMKGAIFALLLAFSLSVSAQTQVRGTVIDEYGEPAIGATIQIKGTTQGTVTDIDGNFTISAPVGGTLVVSYVGYQTQEVPVSANVRVVLTSDSELLEDLVVVAYGVQSARTIASSISTVRADAIRDVPSASFDQMLQGRASGVQITTPSAGVGQPPVVRVRGVNSITSSSSPLFVVDGVPIVSGDVASMGNSNALADINPADIVSMDILKDASAAALYGSRAANGVVLITTRQGQRGTVRVAYDAFVGVSQKTGFYEMMNAQQYVDFKNMAVKNRWGTDLLSELPANAFPTGTHQVLGNRPFNLMQKPGGGYHDTDWSKTAFRTAITNSHTLSFSGGNDRMRYFFSANYMDQEGIVKGDNFTRYGVRTNVTADATDWLRLGANINATSSTTSYVDAARNGSNFSIGGFPRLALINSPNIPAFNDDGTPWGTRTGLGFGPNAVNNTFSNPAKILDIGNGIDVETNRVISIFSGEIRPFSGFVARTQFGHDYAKIEDTRFWSPLHGDGVSSNGLANGHATTHRKVTWSNTLNYRFNIDRTHNFDILAGQEITTEKRSVWTLQRSGLVDDIFIGIHPPYLTATGGGGNTENAMASFFGRINYDYAFKYILSLNFRRDGFSALGANNRWGNFGGAAAAYRISEEAYFDGLKDIVQDFRVKASMGVVGNTGIPNYAARSFYSSYFYGTGGTYWFGQAGDPNLKWESSTKYDVGFSAAFLNRFTLDFDYYFTRSNDLILRVPQAPSKGIPGPTGFNNTLLTNAGDMQNQGIELTFGADIIKSGNFKWSTDLNFTTNRNKIISLADGVENIIGSDASGLEPSTITIPGKSIGQLYLYPTAGVDEKTGRRVFIGSEGERVLAAFGVHPITGEPAGSIFWNEDGTPFRGSLKQEIMGGTLPTWFGGWNHNLSYKRFDMNLFFQFSGGNNIFNGTHATVTDQRFWNNTTNMLGNYWTPERRNAIYPIPVYGDNNSNGSAYMISDWMEKGDYLRLKNVSLGYTFNHRASWMQRAGISNLRLYVQAQNLFTITGYSGMDPEALTNVNSPTLAGGTDKNTLPQARTYTFGINLTF
jgi:TonB-linked SusC/RagA family outer membrane protein